MNAFQIAPDFERVVGGKLLACANCRDVGEMYFRDNQMGLPAGQNTDFVFAH
jgi:hypothetical protein